MVTTREVIEVLRSCYDPQIPINIYDLGLVYRIEIRDDVVNVELTLTSRASPSCESVKGQVARGVSAIPGCMAAITEVVWDPPWSPDDLSDAARRILGIEVRGSC